MKKIGEDELLAASHAHMDRTELYGPKPIERIIESLGVDSEEFHAMAQALRDMREPPDSPSYSAGLIDGFVIGLRAAYAAYGESS